MNRWTTCATPSPSSATRNSSPPTRSARRTPSSWSAARPPPCRAWSCPSSKAGEKIILPRNVHRSVMGALVLCGAIPVYVDPRLRRRPRHPPRYADGRTERDDRAHPRREGRPHQQPHLLRHLFRSSLYRRARARRTACSPSPTRRTARTFISGENMPVSAMAAGADLAAVSMHKSGGSLTQSSLLLAGPNVNADHVRQIINLTQTTSASYLLLSSLDISRRLYVYLFAPRAGGLCGRRRAGRLCARGDQRHRRLVRLLRRAHQRQQHLRF